MARREAHRSDRHRTPVPRITWPDATRLEVAFVDKGTRSTITVTHSKLGNAAEAAAKKSYWAERLDRLQALLERAG